MWWCDMWYIMYLFLLWYWLYYTIVVLLIWKMKNCKAAWAMCLYWFTPCIGEAPKGSRCEPPICCAVCLACVNQIPKWEVLSLSPCSKFLLLPLKAWGHALLRGECVTCKGIWVIQGLYRYEYKYFSQYCVEYSSIWVPLGGTWVLRVLREYLSIWVLSLSLDTKLQLIKEHCRAKIGKVPKIEGCWQLASALCVSQILKNVHRSMQPELILHIKDTGHFNSIDLMFRHHICSSHLTDTSSRVLGSGRTKEISKCICLGVASDLKCRKRQLWPT